MLPILFSIYHRLKFNLSWCARRFLLQYAYILALRFACCTAFMLPGGGRWRRPISSLARSLLNYQLEFISPEDNNSHSARRMRSVLLLFASEVAAPHRHCGEKWAAYALYKQRDTLGHFVRRQKLHKLNKPDGLLNSSMGCILTVHLGQNGVESLWGGGGCNSGASLILIGRSRCLFPTGAYPFSVLNLSSFGMPAGLFHFMWNTHSQPWVQTSLSCQLK